MCRRPLWEEWRLIAINTLEGGEAFGRAGEGVVGIFHPVYLLGSGGGILCDDPNFFLYFPGQGSDYKGRRNDGSRPLSRIIRLLELSQRFSRLSIVGPWTVEGEAELNEERRPARLTRVQSPSSANVLKVFVVCPNQEGFLGTLQQMPPFLWGHLHH